MYFNQNNASTYTTSQPNWLTPKIGVHWRRLPMVCPHPHNQLSSNLSEFITKKTGQRRRLKTHLSFTRDGAVPNHQVHWPIWKCLRLSNKTLYPKFITTNKTHTKKKKQIYKIRNCKIKENQERGHEIKHGDDSFSKLCVPQQDDHEQSLPTLLFFKVNH